MRTAARLALPVLIALVSLLSEQPVWAAPLQYHGGPFLEAFTVYPLYYGNWSATELAAQQQYLVDLAGYLSGANAPALEQPVMKQYGVSQVSVAAAATASPHARPSVLSRTNILKIIHANQRNHRLPAFGPNTLIVLFPAHGFSVNGCRGCGAYHSSESTSAFWAIVPEDQEQAVIAHELFEAAANPAVDTFQGWDEAVDQCDNAALISLSFGKIPPATDNTSAGNCSLTGFTSLGEYQIYAASFSDFKTMDGQLSPQGWRLYSFQASLFIDGSEQFYTAVWRPAGNTTEKRLSAVTYAKFLSEYNAIYPQGWRLYLLQAFALPNGDVLYNATWHPGTTGEQQAYGISYAAFISLYDTLYPAGWRLYILQAYVLLGGEVLYNAVWRPGDTGETQVYGLTYADYKTKYDELFPQGWRLYILDSYVVAGTVRYNAVWRPATHPETQVYGSTLTDYRNMYDALWTQGWRLYILNVYPVPGGELRYDAVWRQGTIDRPL